MVTYKDKWWQESCKVVEILIVASVLRGSFLSQEFLMMASLSRGSLLRQWFLVAAQRYEGQLLGSVGTVAGEGEYVEVHKGAIQMDGKEVVVEGLDESAMYHILKYFYLFWSN